MTVALFCWAGSAVAATAGYTLCSTGAGQAIVSPGHSGHCASHQETLKLARSSTVSSLQSQVDSLRSQTSNCGSGSCFAETVAGGVSNQATGSGASVSGGYQGVASGSEAAILGGSFNAASGQASSVTGGESNTASANYSIAP